MSASNPAKASAWLAAGYWIATLFFALQISFTAYAQLRLPQVAAAFTGPNCISVLHVVSPNRTGWAALPFHSVAVQFPQQLNLTSMINIMHRDPHNIPDSRLLIAAHRTRQLNLLEICNCLTQFLVRPRQEP